MSFLLNKELVEIFEKTFDTKLLLQAFILVHLKNVQTQKQSTLTVYPTSNYWKYFFHLLENQSKCANSTSTENNKQL